MDLLISCMILVSHRRPGSHNLNYESELFRQSAVYKQTFQALVALGVNVKKHLEKSAWLNEPCCIKCFECLCRKVLEKLLLVGRFH